jgi:hypothetical protein
LSIAVINWYYILMQIQCCSGDMFWLHHIFFNEWHQQTFISKDKMCFMSFHFNWMTIYDP